MADELNGSLTCGRRRNGVVPENKPLWQGYRLGEKLWCAANSLDLLLGFGWDPSGSPPLDYTHHHERCEPRLLSPLTSSLALARAQEQMTSKQTHSLSLRDVRWAEMTSRTRRLSQFNNTCCCNPSRSRKSLIVSRLQVYYVVRYFRWIDFKTKYKECPSISVDVLPIADWNVD